MSYAKKNNKSTMHSSYSSELPLLVTVEYFKSGNFKKDAHIYILSYTVNIERSCLTIRANVDYHTFLLNNPIVSSSEKQFQIGHIDKPLDSLRDKTKIIVRDNGVLNDLDRILRRRKIIK